MWQAQTHASGSTLASIVYTDDTADDARDTGFALDAGYAVSCAYDMFGRFHSVSSSVQSAQSVAAYSRLADTDLLEAPRSPLEVQRSMFGGRSLITSGTATRARREMNAKIRAKD